jgi:hypothetical protein
VGDVIRTSTPNPETASAMRRSSVDGKYYHNCTALLALHFAFR